MRTSTSATVRPVTRGDLDAVCSFLYSRADRRIAAKEWRALFTYDWDHEPGFGFVLVDGDEIVGFIGTVRSKRSINGTIHRICNLSTWFVLPDYRGAALPLLVAALKGADETMTGLTPTADAERIYEWVGFRTLDVEKLALPPLLNLRSLARSRSVQIDADRAKIRQYLNPLDRQILDDHSPYCCGHFAIRSPQSYAYVITKRRTKRRIPFSEILYCSDARLFVEHLERLKLAILTRERSLVLMIDRRLLRGHSPLGLRVKRRTVFRSETLAAAEIDNLYTELVLLPN
jgi:acetoacetyl-CoA synthetase